VTANDGSMDGFCIDENTGNLLGNKIEGVSEGLQVLYSGSRVGNPLELAEGSDDGD